MITEEHLNHWLYELKYQLNGIKSHLANFPEGSIMVGGTNLSFDYLNEKATTLQRLIQSIEYDMKEDGEN